MTNKENYNIHNLISFSLINKTKKKGVLENINPEYKYFRSDLKKNNHFNIVIKPRLTDSLKLHKGKLEWSIDINELFEKNSLYVSPEFIGIRTLFTFTALKNLYVRSILMTKLLDVNAALMHSAAFNVKGKTAILAGRPGVFKTSILMDVMRDFNAEFIGEENCLINGGEVYPFPLNIDSISYKIKNYKDENPSGKLQKIKLGFHLLKKNKSIDMDISKPLSINAVFYLEKGDSFEIHETTYDKLLPYLLKNELEELSIPPTHSLSGINYNYFKEVMSKVNPNFEYDFENRLTSVLKSNLRNCKFYFMTSPRSYTKQITKEIVKKISDEK